MALLVQPIELASEYRVLEGFCGRAACECRTHICRQAEVSKASTFSVCTVACRRLKPLLAENASSIIVTVDHRPSAQLHPHCNMKQSHHNDSAKSSLRVPCCSALRDCCQDGGCRSTYWLSSVFSRSSQQLAPEGWKQD